MSRLLSIITVCRDNPDGLETTAASILTTFGSSGLELEWVVVDGSTVPKRLEAIVNAVAASAPWLTVRYQAGDDGVYDAMNRGTSVASGRFVQYLNSGDCFLVGADIRPLIAELSSDPLWVVAGAMHGLGTGTPQVEIQNIPHRWLRHALGIQPHCHQACWFRCDAVVAIGGYDPSVGFVADHQLIMRFGAMGAPVELPGPIIFYEGGGLSASRSAEIPRLLHDVRVRTIEYGDRIAVIIDGAYWRLQHLWRALRGRVSAWRTHR